jgi:hypothetical protein
VFYPSLQYLETTVWRKGSYFWWFVPQHKSQQKLKLDLAIPKIYESIKRVSPIIFNKAHRARRNYAYLA